MVSKFISVFITSILFYIIMAMIWTGLEKAIYGEVQPRIVDDIMAFLYTFIIVMLIYK